MALYNAAPRYAYQTIGLAGERYGRTCFCRAISQSISCWEDAVVWCLDPIKLNSNIRFSAFDIEPIPNICENTELQSMFDSPRQSYPIAIIGPQNTDRIIAQRGVFTLFPNKPSFTIEELDQSDIFLNKIIIPEHSTYSISEELYFMGMTESTLFPELDSISKELKKEYERRRD